jgi:hypothetical protein
MRLVRNTITSLCCNLPFFISINVDQKDPHTLQEKFI